jgi:hypothetical protein
MASIIKVDTIQDQDGNNIINENANTITIGKSGDTVQVAAGAEFVGGGITWQSSIVTGTTLSAVAGNGYWIDTTSNACTVTLPASASVGDIIEFADYARTWQTNNVIINTNSLNYQGNTSPNPTLSTEGQHLKIVYSGATQGWIPTNDDPVALGTPQTYNAEYLVIGGGASGGSGNGGGGGAGGYLTNFGGTAIGLSPGVTYTVTVGGGGSATTFPPKVPGNSGSNSVLSGTGISTITAFGGGAGGFSASGIDGGSGGGGGIANPGGSGTTPQGNDGGASVGTSPTSGGGGGGSSTAGSDGAVPGGGGDGGSSSSNSITGSAVDYAGGGGGGTNVAAPGTGGTAGGGGATNGQRSTNPSSNADANSGSGSGGTDDALTGAGGSGVVILRVPTADYPATTTGSPTVTTDGTDTIIKFTGSGSYTA